MAVQRSVHKSVAEESAPKLAVLIDADNETANVVELLLEEIAGLGEATVRRIYGDFTSTHSSSWKKVLQKYAIKPVQQYAYTTGKNSTDGALIIDAMDLLYTGRFDGFCLVSSDSDFTGLALRLREEGQIVYGFGKAMTPEAFKNACHRFITTEVLRHGSKETNGATPVQTQSTPPQPKPAAVENVKKKFPKAFVLKALENAADDTGWANLGKVGNYLQKLQPDFDSRLYGYTKLSDMLKAKSDLFMVEMRTMQGTTHKALCVKAKEAK